MLAGDLLYKISGVSGKMTTETASEDDNFGTEQGQKIITRMLGEERRNRVLAGQSPFSFLWPARAALSLIACVVKLSEREPMYIQCRVPYVQ